MFRSLAHSRPIAGFLSPLIALVLMLGIQPGSAKALFVFSGSIAAPDASGIDTTGGAWLDSTSVTLSWVVTELGGGNWHYKYTFTTPSKGSLSHIIIELSDGVKKDDIKSLTAKDGGGNNILDDKEVKTYSGADSSNPYMPGSMYGLKVDVDTEGRTNIIEFDIKRAPTWGDFYAKDGTAGSTSDPKVFNTAWNKSTSATTGFVSGETAGLGNDPESDPVTNGSYLGHILVPDSGTVVITAVPVPPSFLLLGLGGTLCAAYQRVRRPRAAAAA